MITREQIEAIIKDHAAQTLIAYVGTHGNKYEITGFSLERAAAKIEKLIKPDHEPTEIERKLDNLLALVTGAIDGQKPMVCIGGNSLRPGEKEAKIRTAQ